MINKTFQLPLEGEPISMQNGKLVVPARPVIPYIEGDGCGADIWTAARPVFDAAVEKAYHGSRKIIWQEVYAGEKASRLFNTLLPEETIQAFQTCLVGIKGPLATPVGGGQRSLNVALRKTLDLYVCQRPVRWFEGGPSPMKHPEYVNMVIFRENTEDIYAGIEFENGSEAARHFMQLFKEHFPTEYARMPFPETSGIGVKVISETGSKRLVRAAINWALKNKRRRLTLVHKGNIMKYTEGSFRAWGYQLAEAEFGEQVYTQMMWERTKASHGEAAANAEQAEALAAGKLHINDVIMDATLELTISHPRDFDVLAAPNLNGDYLSDALAAQVGGLGVAPGANINYLSGAAVFEATHGTAPKLAGQNKVNPTSVILSGEMLLRYLGWAEAADLVVGGIKNAIQARALTVDLAELVEGSTCLGTREFGEAVIRLMK
jgi:isocitrate dehydrogenase